MSYRNSEKISISVPATSANLGPGFDCLGVAWDCCNVIGFQLTESGYSFENCDKEFANGKNLAVQGFEAALKQMNADYNGGLLVCFEDVKIPISRGLGSSAALICGGVIAANELLGLNMNKEEMLAAATAVEGHPDNVAPVLYGGLTAATVDDGQAVCVNYSMNADYHFAALVPAFELSTHLSRSVLPKKVTMADAVFNISRTALLLKALETGDKILLKQGLKDKLHQQYRGPLIEGIEDMNDAAKAAGADGMCISGAGPTLLCISKSPELAENLAAELSNQCIWSVLPLTISEGAKIL